MSFNVYLWILWVKNIVMAFMNQLQGLRLYHYINYNSKIIHNSLLIKVPKIWYVLGIFDVCNPMYDETWLYSFIKTCNLKVQLVMFYNQRISPLEDISWKDKIKLLTWFENIYKNKFTLNTMLEQPLFFPSLKNSFIYPS